MKNIVTSDLSRVLQFWVAIFFTLQCLITPSIVLSLEGDNVCYRYESYTETETIPRNQTVQVLTRQWCLEIPPRCTSYRTEIKEVFVKQNVTKTRRVEFCCEGYQEQRSGRGDEAISECHPICRGGCIHGACVAPSVCSCEAGFSGKHCLQRCKNGTWGVNCKNRCHCQNQSLCDTKNGHCRCVDGWMGKHCETPCPDGFYGTMCGARCDCKTRHCHPQTGTCLPDDEIVMFDNITRTVESSYSVESTERISAEQWIKVENDTTTPSPTTSSAATEVPATSSSSSSSTSTSTTTTTTMTTVATDGSSPEPSSATYAESYHEYLPNNTEMSMVLTKGHSRLASNDSMYELVTTTSRVEITFIDTAVQKVEDHAPLGNASLEELDREGDTEDSANVTDTQLVYLESSAQPVLVGIQTTDQEADRNRRQDESRDRQAFVTISCLLITLALLCSVVAYLKRLDRKTLVKPGGTVLVPPPVKIVDGSVQTGLDPNRSSEPLPDLPHVTYTRVKPKPERTGDLEHYDVPANNSFIHRAKSSPYNYNFSVHSKAPPRKYSLEHIYDEIQYPPLAEITASTTAPADKATQLATDAASDAGYCKPMVSGT
ncbi:abnormal pharyngeal pumping eat-20-like [Anopheles albimanus]|uniref:abnormal pharyngeal pumping eat-20-like n=1 Tax=Anopheles albimanus TaxID=7167 RepID=UPI0016420B2C|nr:abnormal pharyngeal pumping eat-20-like [Anopheles albimanus]